MSFKIIDSKVIEFMKKYGESVEKVLLGSYFVWFGLIKLFGGKSASSIIAQSTYWIEPQTAVICLGLWEIAIGLGLFYNKLIRLSIFLLLLRVPGVILALGYHYDECFKVSFFEPSIQGQYLIKQLTLVGAALVIGSSLKTHKE